MKPTREREIVRSAMLDAARRLFLTEGYANVSMRKIAELIEYSPGAIYSYFANKEDIFFALAEEGLQHLREYALPEGQASASDALGELRGIVWRFYTFSKDHSEYFSLIFIDPSVPRIGREWENVAPMRELRNEVEQRIQHCIDDGIFPRADSPAAIFRLLTTAMYGAAAFRLSRRLPAGEDADALASDLLDTVLAGLRSGVKLRFEPAHDARETPAMSEARPDHHAPAR